MNFKKALNRIRLRRKKRSRAKIFGVADKPRLSVFRSNRDVYVQLINDKEGKTIVSASTKEIGVGPTELVGELIAKKALEKGVKKAVFDKSWYKYHGRVKAVAEGARKGGLQF